MVRSGEAVMEKVRRYRATASLYRQTASFRPLQRWSLLDQAEEWERLAVEELEAYFIARNSRHDERAAQPRKHDLEDARCSCSGEPADDGCRSTCRH